MMKSAHTTPPPDAAARRRAPPVLTYSVDQLPSFDAEFYNAARAELSNVAELMVLPRPGVASYMQASSCFQFLRRQRRGQNTRQWPARRPFRSGTAAALGRTRPFGYPSD